MSNGRYEKQERSESEERLKQVRESWIILDEDLAYENSNFFQKLKINANRLIRKIKF